MITRSPNCCLSHFCCEYDYIYRIYNLGKDAISRTLKGNIVFVIINYEQK